MTTGQSPLELRARSGRAVLVTADGDVDPDQFGLPGSLVRALHEWAEVVDTLAGTGGQDAGQVATRRARQLAVRIALETGGEVGFADPVTGERSVVGRERPARGTADTGQRPGQPPGQLRSAQPVVDEVAEPTPWGTGLIVAAIIAAIVVVSMVIITTGLAEVNPLLAVVVNLAISAGLAPSLWIGRTVLLWRWVALGGAAGIVLSWIALLLSTLGG
jgi:hypothetical protein